jgi:hypothetical protein
LNTESDPTVENKSGNFLSPDQIKDSWNEIVSKDIPSVFSDYIDDHIIAIPLIHTAFDILMEQCQISLKEKYNKVVDVLNLSVKEENKKRLDGKLLPVFREFSSTIFPWSILKIQIITKFKTQFEDI